MFTRPSGTGRATRPRLHHIHLEATAIRRLLVLAALAAALVFPSAVSASGAERTVEPVATAACVNIATYNRFLGNRYDVPGESVRGVSATINPPTDMKPCSNSQGNDGPSAWIAITPGAGNPAYRNPDAILQVGIIKCNNYIVSSYGCQENTFHFFWADGGCNFNMPNPEDLGVAGSGPHTYKIQKNAAGDWQIFIDSTLRKTIDGSASAAIDCWQAGDKMGTWMAESWDGGDQFSTATGTRLQFDLARIQKVVGGTWYKPGLVDPCDYSENSAVFDHKCNVWNGYTDRFEVWSVPL